MLNPSNTKSYMIEGVWPTVRDDDWCGEWKLLVRRADPRAAEAMNASLMSGPQAIATPAVRAAPLTTVTPNGGAGANLAAVGIATKVTPALMGRSASD
jgi:hypothetical protein